MFLACVLCRRIDFSIRVYFMLSIWIMACVAFSYYVDDGATRGCRCRPKLFAVVITEKFIIEVHSFDSSKVCADFPQNWHNHLHCFSIDKPLGYRRRLKSTSLLLFLTTATINWRYNKLKRFVHTSISSETVLPAVYFRGHFVPEHIIARLPKSIIFPRNFTTELRSNFPEVRQK